MGSDIRVATNQAPPLVGHNVVTADAALVEAVVRHAAPEVVEAEREKMAEYQALQEKLVTALSRVRDIRP